MTDQEDLPDYYKILGIERNADDMKIFTAYFDMVKKHALPPGSSSALEHRRELEFAIYQTAYSILSNTQERKHYDSKLRIYENKKKKEVNVQYQISHNQTEIEIEENKRKIEKEEVERIKAEVQKQDQLIVDEKFIKAKQFLQKGNDDDAIALLKEIVERFPKVAQYHSYLGLAMQKKGWTGYSQAEFKVALHFDPKDAIALKNYKNPNLKQSTKPDEKKPGFFSSLFRKK